MLQETEVETRQRSSQKPQHTLGDIIQEGIAYYEDVQGDCLKVYWVFFLFKNKNLRRRRHFEELLLPLHSLLPFPKHDSQFRRADRAV